jgi:hypothetical protein
MASEFRSLAVRPLMLPVSKSVHIHELCVILPKCSNKSTVATIKQNDIDDLITEGAFSSHDDIAGQSFWIMPLKNTPFRANNIRFRRIYIPFTLFYKWQALPLGWIFTFVARSFFSQNHKSSYNSILKNDQVLLAPSIVFPAIRIVFFYFLQRTSQKRLARKQRS